MKLSGEHLISEGLWRGTAISVVGLPWCEHAPKTVGVASLTAKVLCTSHNSALSPVDVAGIGAYRTLLEAAQWQRNRAKVHPQVRSGWLRLQFVIDGRNLERWFLKTLISVVQSTPGRAMWSLEPDAPNRPPAHLVEAAFGRARLTHPMGLYAFAEDAGRITSREHVEIVTLLQGNMLVGAVFGLAGHRFLLNVIGADVPATLSLPTGPTWETGKVFHHLSSLNYLVGQHASHTVAIRWT